MLSVKCKLKEVYAQNLPRMVRAAPWILLACGILAGGIIGYSIKGIEAVSTINQINLAHQAELKRTIELYRPFIKEMADRVGQSANIVKQSAEKVQGAAERIERNTPHGDTHK